MSRLLLLLAIVCVVYLLFRSWGRKREERPDEAGIEDMVRCEHCGVHMPRSESIRADGCFYCSREHYEAARK